MQLDAGVTTVLLSRSCTARGDFGNNSRVPFTRRVVRIRSHDGTSTGNDLLRRSILLLIIPLADVVAT